MLGFNNPGMKTVQNAIVGLLSEIWRNPESRRFKKSDTSHLHGATCRNYQSIINLSNNSIIYSLFC